MAVRFVTRARAILMVLSVGVGLTQGAPPALAGTTAETAVLWTSSFDQSARIENAAASAVSPDGSIAVITGSSHRVGAGHADYLTAAFSTADGHLLWYARAGSVERGDHATAVSISPDGGTTAVTGLSHRRDGKQVWLTIAYATVDGTPLWQARARLPHARLLDPKAVHVGDDEVLIVGNGVRPADGPPPLPVEIVSYGREDGSLRWNATFEIRRYGGAEPGAIVHSSAYAPLQDVLYLGLQVDETPELNSMGVLAIDADTGSRLWRSHFVSPTYEAGAHPYAIALAPDASTVYVGGTFDCCDIRYVLAFATADGALRWSSEVTRLPGDGPPTSSSLSSLTVSPDGTRLFGAGRVLSEPDPDSGLVEGPLTFSLATADGANIWRRRVGAAVDANMGSDQGVAVAPDGSTVYMTTARGLTSFDPDYHIEPPDILTMSYDAVSGRVGWSHVVGSDLGPDRPTSIDALGDEILVCGTLAGSETHADLGCFALAP